MTTGGFGSPEWTLFELFSSLRALSFSNRQWCSVNRKQCVASPNSSELISASVEARSLAASHEGRRHRSYRHRPGHVPGSGRSILAEPPGGTRGKVTYST